MQKEVRIFKGKDIPCDVEIDKTKYLPDYNEDEGEESSLGGISLHAKKGRIVCSNTLEDRLELCY